jgi:ParB family chromosome partitioning protein
MGLPGETSARSSRPMEGQSVTTPKQEYTLQKYDAMCRSIEDAASVDEVKDIRDKALAFQMYAKQAKNLKAERLAAEIRIRAERKCGELLAEMPKAKGGNPNLPTPNKTEGVATLADMGISYRQSSGWQKLAAMPEEQFEKAVGEIEIPSLFSVLNHRAQGTGQNEWYTPAEYIEAVRDVLGTIDLDPASSAIANETVKATSFYSVENNGLELQWHGKVFLNPPYAQPFIAQFIEKLVSEFSRHRVTEAVALTNDSSDTEWFHWAGESCSAICHTRGRISFISPNGVKGSPLQGQAFFYFGNNVQRFAERFHSIGFVVVPYVF